MSSCLTDHVCRGFIVKRRVKRRELVLTCVLWFSCALSPWFLSVVRGGVECQALQVLQSDWKDRVLGLRRHHLALVLRHVQHIGMLSPHLVAGLPRSRGRFAALFRMSCCSSISLPALFCTSSISTKPGRWNGLPSQTRRYS